METELKNGAKRIGYCRVSKMDGSQKLDLQIDALKEAGVEPDDIYFDKISGAKDQRPGLENMLKAMREGDKIVIWSLDRLGRNLKHLINIVQQINDKGAGLQVLKGQGAGIDTSTAHGMMVFHIFGALSEFERELIRERTRAGILAARMRGKHGGRKFKVTKAQVRLMQASMGKLDTNVSELCRELGITMTTLYRYVSPKGELRKFGERVMGK